MNNQMKTKKIQSYTFGLSDSMEDKQLEHLIHLFNSPTSHADRILEGRCSVMTTQLESIGSVVIKHYMRGGLIEHINKNRYLKIGKTRCRLEFEVLKKIRSLGVSAPEPVAFASYGNLFYKAWLVTKEISNQQSLSLLSKNDIKRALTAVKQLVKYILILVENKILHVDLHPGNVLVTEDHNVYLIDFDKAHLFNKNKLELKKKYNARWKRAVIKHDLPESLINMFEQELF